MNISSRKQYLFPVFLAVFLVGFCFQNVSSAYAASSSLEKQLKSGKKDIHFSSKSSGDIKIRKNVSVTGDSLSKAVINGDVKMENGSTLRNVTINAKNRGITIAKDASVTLINVTIKGADDTGIITSGKGTLTVKDSRITKNRKGFYIQPGKHIVFTNNDITNNKEEGIDLRNNVSGAVSSNRISHNREGGMEVIVNGASITISGNTLADNKKSGLVFQFYPKTSSNGNVRATSNTISGNKKFGIGCGSPSGGKVPQGFFARAVNLSGNSFGKGNDDGNIQKSCGLNNVSNVNKKAE